MLRGMLKSVFFGYGFAVIVKFWIRQKTKVILDQANRSSVMGVYVV